MAYHAWNGTPGGPGVTRAMYIDKVDLGPPVPTLNSGHPFQLAQGITDIGTLPGGTSSILYSVNDAGQATGSSTTGAPGCGSLTRPISYSLDDGITELTTAACTTNSYEGLAINQSGLIVATGSFSPQCDFVSYPPYVPQVGINYRNRQQGTLAFHPFLAQGSVNCGFGVNDAGEAVGVASLKDGFDNPYRAYRWAGLGAPTDLTSSACGTCLSWAYDIDNNGESVGSWINGVDGMRVFRQSGLSVTQLGTIGGAQIADPIDGDRAFGTNDQGIAVGYAHRTDGVHAVRWDESGSASDILSGFYGRANAVNNHGQVVGARSTNPYLSDPIGFVWQPGKPLTLIYPPPGFNRLRIWGISDSGLIVGDIRKPDGTMHGFITEAPPPY